MEELKIDYKFSLEDFKVMENIEHSYSKNRKYKQYRVVSKNILKGENNEINK